MEDMNNNLSERPTSRRGIIGTSTYLAKMSDAATPNPVAVLRPATGIKTSAALRSGTASRLMANNNNPTISSTTQRIGNVLEDVGNKIAERPITQHGISGLSTSSGRLGTSTSGIRQIKDKRYWLAVLQSKIHEINQETSKLLKDKKFLDRERSARKLYEKRAKEATKELTNLQSILTSINLALDNYSSGMTRQRLFNETTVLRERNQHIQEQLEQIFKQRQLKDAVNRDLDIETEKEKNKIIELTKSLPDEEQRKYQEFQSLSEQLRKQNSKYHAQIGEIGKQKERLASLIMNTPSRAKVYTMKSKLKELVTKRNTMTKEQHNRPTPVQEREKLINEVRSNNQALGSIGKRLKIVEDELIEKKEILQQIENDLEEGKSERTMKYKELKKRDDVMSTFMENFKRNMDHEKQNKETLKYKITYSIEQITLQGINMKRLGVDKVDGDGFPSKTDFNSNTGLMKAYKKLVVQLKQLHLLEKRTGKQIYALHQQETETLQNIQKYTNLEVPRTEAITKMDDLSSSLQELDDKKRITEDVIQEARNRNQEVKINLKSNETYRQISYLEDKLVDLLKENKSLQGSVDHMQQENDYSTIFEAVLELVNDHNILLSSQTENFYIQQVNVDKIGYKILY